MFAILPVSDDYVKDDSEFFTNLEIAYERALDWSVELNGATVNIYEHYQGKYNLITSVFA
jgi:hypothetical protein